MRELDGLALLKEVVEISKTPFGTLKSRYYESCVIINRITYIRIDALDEDIAKKVTPLCGFVSVSQLANKLCVPKSRLSSRIKTMRELGDHLYFEYKEIANNYYIKLDKKNFDLFSRYEAYVVDKNSAKQAQFCKLIGDITVGFY